MSAHASFENDTVKVTEAKSIARLYGAQRLSLLFFIGVGSSGISSVQTKPMVKLTAVLGNSSGVRRVKISPSPLAGSPFSDVNPNTFVIYPTGQEEEHTYTIDNHNTYPVEHIQGHVFFDIPINTGEYLLTTLIIANA
jgi:hypothetical protein